jgi:hypothetical protein
VWKLGCATPKISASALTTATALPRCQRPQ